MRDNKTVNNELFIDSCTLGYNQFQVKYRSRFEYVFDSRHRFDESDWNWNCLRVDDEYFALFKDWRNGGRHLVGGDQRQRYLCLLERSYLRRILKPDTTADELYWNLYEEVYAEGLSAGRRVVDNTDKAINRGLLKGIAERAMEPEQEWIQGHYAEDIAVLKESWTKHHPNGIVSRGPEKRLAVKMYRFDEISQHYDISKTRQENIEALAAQGISVSESYLKKHGIGSREKKEKAGIAKSRWTEWRRRKKNNEVHKRLSLDEAKDIYDPTLSDAKNIERFHELGYGIGKKSLQRIREAEKESATEVVLEKESPVSFPVPSFCYGFPSVELPKEEPIRKEEPQTGFSFPQFKPPRYDWLNGNTGC